MHRGDKASLIVYFTLLLGEHCSHMMINRTLEHVHHNALIISSLLMPYILMSLKGTHTFLKAKFKTFFRFFLGFPSDILDTFKQQNLIIFIELDDKYLNSYTDKVFLLYDNT